MTKPNTKTTALENAKEQLMNYVYGDDVTAILKPLTDSELKDLAAYFAEQWELGSSNIGYDLAQKDDDGGLYYETEDAISLAEDVLDYVRCVELVQSEITLRAEKAAKKPRLVK